MAEVDPNDAVAVAAVLATLASERFGCEVAVVGSPTRAGEGFDSYIHRVQLAGPALPAPWTAPLVVRLLPSVDRIDQAHAEAAVQGWCAEHGYPAPAILSVLAPDEGFALPAQVMERAEGVTVLDVLKARPWRALALVDLLVELQLRLHGLDAAGWPGPDAPRALVDKRLGLPRRVIERTGSPDLAAAMRAVEGLIPIAVADPAPVICHGDFHPLNVMVDGERASVLDWTDAGIGPREADVARTLLLFRIASIAAGGSLERLVLKVAGPRLARRYRRAYERGAALDPGRLLAWEALHALHGWSQVVMLHSGGFDGASSARADDIPLGLATYLRGRLESAVATLT